jgi:hypothetical protein
VTLLHLAPLHAAVPALANLILLHDAHASSKNGPQRYEALREDPTLPSNQADTLRCITGWRSAAARSAVRLHRLVIQHPTSCFCVPDELLSYFPVRVPVRVPSNTLVQ